MKGRLSITEVAKTIGVTPRTIMRWEKSSKIKKSKRDWRGWRFYTREDVEGIRNFYESIYEYNELEGSLINSGKPTLVAIFAALSILSSIVCADALAGTVGVKETPQSVDIVLDQLPVREVSGDAVMEGVKYTLGPNDVISIEVKRHPEFSGEYKINSEGKIEYKYVGDVIINSLTKKECKARLEEVLSEYLIRPTVDVQIVAYLSKVFYVVGDVGRPGKYYMRGDTISVRKALFESGLPTQAASMRKCRIITPNEKGKDNIAYCNVFSLLYEGNLKENLTMKPGDVLYVPATIMAKALRVISPVTTLASQTVGGAIGAASSAAVLF